MKGVFNFLVLALHILCRVSEAARPLTSRGVNQTGEEMSPWTSGGSLKSNEGFGDMCGDAKMTGEEAYCNERVSKIGSSPPSCEHKCFGCVPCEATQITTPSGNSHVRVQYANYEPIGWKCMCGPSFYSP